MLDALLALMAVTATSQGGTAVQIDLGRTNWASYPQLPETRQVPRPEHMVERLSQILRHGECQMRGQRPDRFDVTVPYLVLVEPDGRASRAVVGDTGCRPLEAYVADLVTSLSSARGFGPTGDREARWYASSFNFSLEPYSF